MKEWILCDIDEQESKLNLNATMYRLTWFCMSDGELYQSTHDSSYDNFKRCKWDEFLSQDNPYGAYGNLKRVKRTTIKGMPVVTADSKLKHIRTMTVDDIVSTVEARKAELNPTRLDLLNRVVEFG